jgi:hypothetical protein
MLYVRALSETKNWKRNEAKRSVRLFRLKQAKRKRYGSRFASSTPKPKKKNLKQNRRTRLSRGSPTMCTKGQNFMVSSISGKAEPRVVDEEEQRRGHR